MPIRRTSVRVLTVLIAAVAASGAGTVLAASASQTHIQVKAASHVGAVYAHAVGGDPGQVKVRIPRKHQTGKLIPVKVPAGSYLVTFTAHWALGSESDATFYCSLAFRASKSTFGSGFSVQLDPESLQPTSSEQQAVTFRTPGTISAYCGTGTGDTGGTAGIANAELTALDVSTVHQPR
jgi:hypothetical protein